MAQFCVVVFNSEICVKYVCKIKSNILQNLCFFFFSKHTNSPYRAAKLISMTKCRTMNKMVADTKDCCCLQVPSHLQNLALQYLSFNHDQRHHLHRSVFYKTQSSDQNWKQRLSKKTDITWHHQRFSDPLLLPSLWDISQGGGGKKFLDGQNARNINFLKTHFWASLLVCSQ